MTAAENPVRNQRIAMVALYVLGLAALLWPALYNGQALLFFDTTAYFNGAASALKAIGGIDSHWLHPTGANAGTVGPVTGPVTGPAAGGGDRFVNAGRSVYYGLLVLSGDLVAGLWGSVILQALIVTWAITLLVRGVVPGHPLSAPLVIIALGLSTTLSFFTSYLMPDVLTGVGILAVSVLLARWSWLSRGARMQWFVLLLIALAAHSTHVLIAVLMLVAGVLLAWVVGRRVPRGAVATVGLALLCALGLQFAFAAAVTRIYGQPPSNPPFITARLVEDGPGYRYLRATCPGNGFRVCEYTGQLPEFSDDFLWSREPGKAVFSAAGTVGKDDLSSEQFRFALAVLRFDFFGQVVASLKNFGMQLTRFSLGEFAFTPELGAFLSTALPPDLSARIGDQRMARGHMPLGGINVMMSTVFAAAAVTVAVFLVRTSPRGVVRLAPDGRLVDRPGDGAIDGLWQIVMLIVLGVIFNALITGVLSTVHDRYQARVVWLIPLAMLLIGLSRLSPKPYPDRESAK